MRSGDVAAELRQRLRAGKISRASVRAMAYLGDKVALEVLEACPACDGDYTGSDPLCFPLGFNLEDAKKGGYVVSCYSCGKIRPWPRRLAQGHCWLSGMAWGVSAELASKERPFMWWIVSAIVALGEAAHDLPNTGPCLAACRPLLCPAALVLASAKDWLEGRRFSPPATTPLGAGDDGRWDRLLYDVEIVTHADLAFRCLTRIHGVYSFPREANRILSEHLTPLLSAARSKDPHNTRAAVLARQAAR